MSVSQRQQDVEQVISTQIHTIFTVYNTINILTTVPQITCTHKKFIYRVKGVCIKLFS
jgi:hypothetical protein